MSAARGWYSVIQYCPDPSRAESANVGVLLFCPEKGFVRATTSPGNDRVRRFFRIQGPELKRITAAKRSLERRVKVEAPHLRKPDDLKQFIRSRAHTLILTDPRELRVEEPEEELNRLFHEVVGGRARRIVQEPASIVPQLEQAFQRLKGAGRESIRFDVKMTVPLVEKQLRTHYAYQNGKLCLVKAITSHDGDSDTSQRALRLAGMGRLINLHSAEFDMPSTLIIASALNERESLESRLERIFKDHDVEFYPAARLDELISRAEQEAK